MQTGKRASQVAEGVAGVESTDRVRVLTRRQAIGMFVATAGSALLAACTPPAPSAPRPEAPPTAVPAAQQAAVATPRPTVLAAADPTQAKTEPQPRSGGTLKVGSFGDLSSLEPIGVSFTALDTSWLVYERLTGFDEALKPEPMLAESWDISSDYTQVKLNLRRGAQWHTGRDFTSEDVRFNIARAADPTTTSVIGRVGGAQQLLAMAQWWTSVETPDKNTIILKSDKPRPGVFDFFEYFNMADPQSIGSPDAASKAVGTGPFMWSEWAAGDHIRLSKNPNYWRAGRPYVDEVVYSIFTDAQTMAVNLEAGVLDGVIRPQWVDATRIAKDPKFRLNVNDHTGAYYLVATNTTQPPADNKTFRQAMNYAIDRKRFVESVLGGVVGTPKDLPWPAESAASEPAKNTLYSFDLDKAKTLFAASGIGSTPVSLIYQRSGPGGDLAKLGEIMQADLAKVGVTLAVLGLEPAAWSTSTSGRKDWALNAGSSSYGQLQPPSLSTLSAWWGYATGSTGFRDDTYTRLITSAAVEPDAAKRSEWYSQINDFLLDQSFVMPIAPQPPTFLTRANLNGVRYGAHENLLLSEVWLG